MANKPADVVPVASHLESAAGAQRRGYRGYGCYQDVKCALAYIPFN